MSDFKAFAQAVSEQFIAIGKNDSELFVVDIPDLYELYINAFPSGTNPIFRERTEHDCNTCKHFIRNLGKVVAIQSGEVSTVWDIAGVPEPYNAVAETLANAVRNADIASVFRTKEPNYGHASNKDNHDPGITWYHFHGNVPRRFLTSEPSSVKGRKNAVVGVFRRGLDEFKPEDIDTVIDLINQNLIYRGREFLSMLKEFKETQELYIEHGRPKTFVWEHSDSRVASLRNTVIGTLLTDLSNGDTIDSAVAKFEVKVAPVNYKRPTALITPQMIDQAVTKLKELDLDTAIERRLASFEDLSVNDVLFVDNSVIGRMKDSITDLLLSSSSTKKTRKTPKQSTDISIGDFLKLGSKTVELILSSRHKSNFVTVTAPVHSDVRRLFKWSNNFAWSYDGEVTDSIKERVIKAGGNVHDAKLRVSLAWSNFDDLDIHARCPDGQHIFYGAKSCCATGDKILDVDQNAGMGYTRTPVENLSWRRIQDGVYTIHVNQFNKRENQDFGFKLQVESDGVTHEFEYSKAIPNSYSVRALTIEVENGKVVQIKAHEGVKGEGEVVIQKWGVSTGTPTKVNAILLSPNHWEQAGGVGNKHWFFILDNCKTDQPVRGIYNEFLISDFEPYRKVFEVLGSKTKCQPCEKQLSGVGFSETRTDVVNAIADGRPYKIHF